MARPPQSWQKFREFDLFGENFDELFDRFLGLPAEAATAAGRRAPALESFVEDDKLVVRADLPGVDPSQLEVTIAGAMLTVRGTREERREEKQRNFIHREVSYGSFERSVSLPYPVKADAVVATYQNGVLELVMPRAAEATPRKVAVEIESRRASSASSGTKTRP